MPSATNTESLREDLSFERFVVRPAARQLLIDGDAAKLGARAFDLLMALIERRERVVGKDELLEAVWPGLVVEENNLQVQISTLRRLLGPQVILTVPGRGYRFAATPEPMDAEAAPPPASVPADGNVPNTLPRLYGRDRDLARLVGLLEEHPLVTVVGAPGLGKTVLALAAADALRGRWPGGAWVADLANVSDPEQLPAAVAQCLRITLPGQGARLEELVGVLRSQSLLLVLDNCEHLVGAVAALADAIVRRAPGVRVLATSQELLNVPDEVLFKLDALAVPGPEELDRAAEFGAIRLFTERARAVDPQFELTPGHASDVAEICRRLDGLPLAIELAAARVRLLGVAGVRERMGERFRMLTGGARSAMRRHQTLQAAIDWSHALLTPVEQRVLRRLGVFVGGFTLELAQQVAGEAEEDSWNVIDAVGALVDRSLVAVDPDPAPRYRLLETTRAYTLQKLADAGETRILLERHARAVRALFAQTEELRFGETGRLDMLTFTQRLSPELDNQRAAISWALAEGGDPELAVSLAASSVELYRVLSISQELLPLMGRLRATVDASADEAGAALFLFGLSTLGVGRLPTAQMMSAEQRAVRIFRALGLRRRLYLALYVRAWTLLEAGEHAQAEAVVAELEALEDPAWPAWVRSMRLNACGYVRLMQGRLDEALAQHIEQRRLLEAEAGEAVRWSVAMINTCAVLGSMRRFEDLVATADELHARLAGESAQLVRGTRGYHAWMLIGALVFLGRLEEADRAMREALPGWRRDALVTTSTGVLAMLLAERGRLAAAAKLLGAFVAFLERSGVKPYPYQRFSLERARELVAALEAAELDRLLREGATLDDAALEAVCLGDD